MRRPNGRLLCVTLCLFAFTGIMAAEPANWTAKYPPCKRHGELLKHGPMSLGVRLATANVSLAQQFKEAMDFWASILDLDWHEDNTESCSMELIDGGRELFEAAPDIMVARSQFPDRTRFQGWIVFNPAVVLTKPELYRISVHEIGHMLGLRHNPSSKSLMYDLDLESSECLDLADLASLSAHHKLRATSHAEPVILTKLR